jgi:hypothetical protein
LKKKKSIGFRNSSRISKGRASEPWRYDCKNLFAKKFGKINGVFRKKYNWFVQNLDITLNFSDSANFRRKMTTIVENRYHKSIVYSKPWDIGRATQKSLDLDFAPT